MFLKVLNQYSNTYRDTVAEIAENPYMQYFIGLLSFIEEAPFDASLMIHFRKRLSKNIINEINEMIAKEAAKPKSDDDNISGGSTPNEPGS
jgi:IS5 family transposase